MLEANPYYNPAESGKYADQGDIPSPNFNDQPQPPEFENLDDLEDENTEKEASQNPDITTASFEPESDAPVDIFDLMEREGIEIGSNADVNFDSTTVNEKNYLTKSGRTDPVQRRLMAKTADGQKFDYGEGIEQSGSAEAIAQHEERLLNLYEQGYHTSEIVETDDGNFKQNFSFADKETGRVTMIEVIIFKQEESDGFDDYEIPEPLQEGQPESAQSNLDPNPLSGVEKANSSIFSNLFRQQKESTVDQQKPEEAIQSEGFFDLFEDIITDSKEQPIPTEVSSELSGSILFNSEITASQTTDAFSQSPTYMTEVADMPKVAENLEYTKAEPEQEKSALPTTQVESENYDSAPTEIATAEIATAEIDDSSFSASEKFSIAPSAETEFSTPVELELFQSNLEPVSEINVDKLNVVNVGEATASPSPDTSEKSDNTQEIQTFSESTADFSNYISEDLPDQTFDSIPITLSSYDETTVTEMNIDSLESQQSLDRNIDISESGQAMAKETSVEAPLSFTEERDDQLRSTEMTENQQLFSEQPFADISIDTEILETNDVIETFSDTQQIYQETTNQTELTVESQQVEQTRKEKNQSSNQQESKPAQSQIIEISKIEAEGDVFETGMQTESDPIETREVVSKQNLEVSESADVEIVEQLTLDYRETAVTNEPNTSARIPENQQYYKIDKSEPEVISLEQSFDNLEQAKVLQTQPFEIKQVTNAEQSFINSVVQIESSSPNSTNIESIDIEQSDSKPVDNDTEKTQSTRVEQSEQIENLDYFESTYNEPVSLISENAEETISILSKSAEPLTAEKFFDGPSNAESPEQQFNATRLEKSFDSTNREQRSSDIVPADEAFTEETFQPITLIRESQNASLPKETSIARETDFTEAKTETFLPDTNKTARSIEKPQPIISIDRSSKPTEGKNLIKPSKARRSKEIAKLASTVDSFSKQFNNPFDENKLESVITIMNERNKTGLSQFNFSARYRLEHTRNSSGSTVAKVIPVEEENFQAEPPITLTKITV